MQHISAAEEALPTAATMTYLAFIAALPPEVVMGSFTGSVIFLLGSKNKTKWQWLIYFMAAFMTGLLGASVVAEICQGILKIVAIHVTVPHGLGATIAAACTINVISWFRDNPSFFFTRKNNGDPAQ